MFRNSHAAQKVDTLQFNLMEKSIYWTPTPLRCALCGKWFQSGVKFYMITVLQPFMDEQCTVCECE